MELETLPISHEWDAPSVTGKSFPDRIWPEPLDTPGYVPHHLKRAASGQFPILELIQRVLYRLKPSGVGEVEKLLALIGLYQTLRPVYTHIKDFCIWALTVQVTVPESDPVAKEILAWIGSEVITNSHSRNAMLVTSSMQDANDDFHRRMIMPPPPGVAMDKRDDGVLCLPPIGTRLFWVGFRPFVFSRRGGNSYSNHRTMSGHMVDDRGLLQNAITLMTLGWSLKPLQDFTAMCHDFKLKHLTGTTTVYFAGEGRNDPYGNVWYAGRNMAIPSHRR